MILGDTCTRACAFCNVRPAAQAQSILPSRRGSARPSRRLAFPMSWSPRSIATIWKTAAPRISPRPSRPSRAKAPQRQYRSADARTSCARRGRSRSCWRRGPTCSTTISRPCRRSTARSDQARATHIRCDCSSAPRRSIRSSSPSPASCSASARARRKSMQVMDDLRAADVDFLTIGQYLQPTRNTRPSSATYRQKNSTPCARRGLAKGFLLVAASPLTRSSYHASDDFAALKAARHASASALGALSFQCISLKRSTVSAIPLRRCSRSSPPSRTIRNSCRSARQLEVKRREFAGRQGNADRHHDRRLSADPRKLHHRSNPRQSLAHHLRVLSRWPVRAS